MTDMISLLTQEPFLLAGIAGLVVFLAHSALTHHKQKAWLDKQPGPDKRIPLYNKTMLHLWGMAALSTIAWLLSGRDLTALGFTADFSIGFWIISGLTIAVIVYYIWQTLQLMTSIKSRRGFRKQLAAGGDLDLIMPTTPREHRSFHLISITAGITEEIMFRGFLIGVFALFMPL